MRCLPASRRRWASTHPSCPSSLAYTILGTSAALAVGPVAVISLMTATAIGNRGLTAPGEIIGAAITLAFMSGLILLAMGAFRLGFLANFLSHPVIAGFITASGIIIAASQLEHILGIDASGHNLLELLTSISAHLAQTNFLPWPSAAPLPPCCSGSARG
jgi:SulP family sulfate permease